MKKTLTFKLTLCAIFSALATISFLIENLFPPIILPGAKMGVSNIFILLSLIVLGWQYAFFTLLIKVILGSLFAGNISAIIYSLPAGVLALSVEIILLRFINRVSVVGVSVIGSVINVTTQNVVFCLVTNTVEYLFYSPYLALIGIFSGVVIGFSVYLLITKIKFFNSFNT